MTARVALVTGAASGIGRVAAARLASTGWTVAAVDLPGDALDSVAETTGAVRFPCDVTDARLVQTTAEKIRRQLGDVHRLVNAAGIAVAGRIDELPATVFAETMAVNYLGTVHWVQALLPGMRDAGRGELALIASLAGWMPTPEMGAYTATKFAVVGFAETLAMELRGCGITVRCVCPMAVRTPMLNDIVGQGRHDGLQRLVPFITPERVVDALERSLRKRRAGVMVFPDASSAVAWRARRWAPAALAATINRFGMSR
ncbi:MAG: SDR family oxidoreductase [Actinomycetota bacterium]|nr:SDR family oxidoreductase [Actinomycetota bacterium]